MVRCTLRLRATTTTTTTPHHRDTTAPGLSLAHKLGDFGTDAGRRQMAVHLNGLAEVLSWKGPRGEADSAAKDAARAAGWPEHGKRRPSGHFDPALAGPGWLDASAAGFRGVAAAVAALRGCFQRLRKEYSIVRKAGILVTQPECLHDPKRGRWWQLQVIGEQGARECAASAAPAACECIQGMLGAAREAGQPVTVARAGYSVVEARTHIRPHTGPDNRVLKLHLGLRIPTAKAVTAATEATKSRGTQASLGSRPCTVSRPARAVRRDRQCRSLSSRS